MDPGFAIVILFGSLATIGAGITRMWFSHEERKIKLRLQGGSSEDVQGLRTDMEALRTELARLRDTSTQYDISIQHALEDVQQRLERVEGRRSATTPAAREEAPAQETVGLRAG